MTDTRAPQSPARFLGGLLLFYVLLANLQRLIYIGWIHHIDHTWPPGMALAFAKGLVFDLSAATYMFLPLFFLLLLPARWRAKGGLRTVLLVVTTLPLYVACTAAICELFFFEEFHARFNFIAVDYLVYTQEVIRNIFESYPTAVVIGTFTLPMIFLIWILRRQIRRLDPHRRLLPGWGIAIALVMAVALIGLPTEDGLLARDAYWPREVSKNSLFALFAAYSRNSINFIDFYTSLDPKEARSLTEKWLGGPLPREVHSDRPEQHWNVVLVAMESMSASFLHHFGNKKIITPNLDRLGDEGLLFTNLYASGTRTVRGLEALMLSLPPTPGQSILRRPNSDGLFTLGTVFHDHGYRTQFVYGGYALFDNMKEWFSGNGFEIVDRGSFPSDEIHFANAWGVCDEDLFTQLLKEQQKLYDAHTPFFQVVLTTSNHRPYTFPDGRIDMPSHSGREAAIKYSDYAIGKFIEEAKTKPWFDNTLFIFIADHDASVAGGIDIPVHDFHIPAIFYNPKLVPPRRQEKLAAQIDIAPTLLGMLGFSYRSKFFGQDLERYPGGRALMGTYQKVSLLEPGRLTILSPGHLVEMQQLDENFSPVKTISSVQRDGSQLPETSRTAIAIYQTASDLFARGLLKLSAYSSKPNE